tara:strand:- start:261 stop:554 length:294 start_codon:yes stop_codon:yes gene_type:complete
MKTLPDYQRKALANIEELLIMMPTTKPTPDQACDEVVSDFDAIHTKLEILFKDNDDGGLTDESRQQIAAQLTIAAQVNAALSHSRFLTAYEVLKSRE